MPHILAIDQGTTSTRAIVFDAQDARPVASAQVELKQYFPQPGWVEHDPVEIADAAISVARQAIERAGLRVDSTSAKSGRAGSFDRLRMASGQRGLDIGCIGIANQRETTVVWERATGRPVSNAIVWQCRRTADMCRTLEAQGHGPDIRTRTGLVLDAYFSATKLRWLLDSLPDGQKRAEDGALCFGTVDSWLLFRLTMRGDAADHGGALRQTRGDSTRSLTQTPSTGSFDTPRTTSGQRLSQRERAIGAVHATDSTNASRTMLLNLHDLQWDPALLSLFDIPEVMLPEVRPSASNFGVTAPGIFGAEIPVTGMAGDQHAAFYGQACFEPGMVKCTYGTGAFVLSATGSRPPAVGGKTSASARPSPSGRGVSDPLAPTLGGHPSPEGRGDSFAPSPFAGEGGGEGSRKASHGLLATLGWEAGPKRMYALEGSVFITGAAVQWLRDGLGIVNGAAEASALAGSVEDNGDVYFVPAFVGLGAPHWDAGARGTITGLTRGTGRAHIARAALEAAAYQVRDVVAAMDSASRRGYSTQPLRADGGQTASEFLMQFQADILGRPVEVSAVPESSAFGAALLAGRGSGIWQNEREVAALWQAAVRYEPQMSEGRRLSLIAGWNDAVRRARLLAPR